MLALFVRVAAFSVLFTTLVSAAALPSCNTPSDRSCWVTGFNTSTDYEQSTPFTGVTQSVRLLRLHTGPSLIMAVHLDRH